MNIKTGVSKLDFDRRLLLQFRGSVVTSDAGSLAYHVLDHALALSAGGRRDTRRRAHGQDDAGMGGVGSVCCVSSGSVAALDTQDVNDAWPALDHPP